LSVAATFNAVRHRGDCRRGDYSAAIHKGKFFE